MELIAFSGSELLAEGPGRDVLEKVLRYRAEHPEAEAELIVMERRTSTVLDMDFEQPLEVIENELSMQAGETPDPIKRGRGRPKLGVQSREVSLLPRHWDWLNRQPGGASAALRRLVDAARTSPESQLEEARLAVDRFLMTMAGDLPNYEEALRQFYRRQYGAMFERMATWPDDIQRHARSLVNEVRAWEVESADPRGREKARSY